MDTNERPVSEFATGGLSVRNGGLAGNFNPVADPRPTIFTTSPHQRPSRQFARFQHRQDFIGCHGADLAVPGLDKPERFLGFLIHAPPSRSLNFNNVAI